jgi:hypothetical protein
MKHEALDELRYIMNVPDEQYRRPLFEDWVARWTVTVKFTQDVVNTDALTSEHSDLIKIKLAQSLAEDLAEDCVSYEVREKKITASLCGLRRRAK